MDARASETDALLRVCEAMDRLLSLLPAAQPALLARPAIPALLAATAPRPEDLAIEQAMNEVLEYHRTHRPKNTSRNYGPKQKE